MRVGSSLKMSLPFGAAADDPDTRSGWKSLFDFMERSGLSEEKSNQHVAGGYVLRKTAMLQRSIN